MRGFRAELPVAGRKVLVVGASTRAIGVVAALRDAGAHVHVVAPQAVPAVADLADRGLVQLRRRAFEPGDLEGAWLVVASSDDSLIDAEVSAEAERRGVFCIDAGVGGSPPNSASTAVGRVVLVGGGPGDPGLITMAGMAFVREADVVVTDRLAPLAVLAEVRPGAEIIDVSKIPGGRATPQERINELLVEHARAGRLVVRLKGGDNFVFGRGGEEWQACARAGIPVHVVPGVSSATAAPAAAGIPLTHRTANQGFTVITAHVPPGDPRSTLDYAALARSATALVLMMGVGTLAAVAQELITQGMDPLTPAATVADGTLPSQRAVRGPLRSIAALTAEAGIRPPAITVIGSVAAFDPMAG